MEGATKTAFSFQIMTGYHGHNLIRVEPEMLNAFILYREILKE